MLYRSEQNDPRYFPPLLGNGDIAFSPDCEGTLNYDRTTFRLNKSPSGCLFRAGRRLPVLPHSIPPAAILSFGTFRFDAGSPLARFGQELICEDGIVKSACGYADGLTVDSVCLIHPRENLYALQKMFHGAPRTVSYTYAFRGHKEAADKAIERRVTEPDEFGARIFFTLRGQDVYRGAVSIHTDRKPDAVTVNGDSVTLSCEVRDGDTLCLYVAIEDDLDGVDYAAALDRIDAHAARAGFDGLLNETVADWRAYFSEGFVSTGNPALDQTYRCCLYGIRCFTTRWSIPVGLNDMLWDGKFFAFDEYYSYLALLESNRTALARRVPEFRSGIALDEAVKMTTRFTGTRFEEQARFPWETNEYGEEVSATGIWRDHIFHAALSAQGAFEYYEHTRDAAFLKHCYRLIKACAKYYTLHMLYEDTSGAIFLGRCTDLERLGPSVLNPFFSACGVIRTLEICAEAAEILETDEDYRAECLDKARRLRRSLSKENGLYVPFKGCADKSIAVFAGKFPFDVLADDDAEMFASWADFERNEDRFGNMYAVGKHVSPWYACWKGEGYARTGYAEKTADALSQALESAGVFGEMFEINEPDHRLNPWFTTAEGIFVTTLDEALLQSDGESLFLLPAWPLSDEPVSFRLSAKGGAIVEAQIRGSELTRLTVALRPGLPARTFRVFLRGRELASVRAEYRAE